MNTILLVEDDKTLQNSLREYLENEGFSVRLSRGQREASMILDGGKTDLALVDITLEDGDGFGVLEKARSLGVPVVFLTASGDETSVVKGLDMGACDYISKPFRPRELVSRISGVLRRSGKLGAVVTLGDITVDTVKGTVSKNGADLFLSALEYRLLLVLLNNRGIVMSRAKLLEDIWDVTGDFVNDNTLTVYIKRLRDKLEDDPADPAVIKTVRGIGYRVD